MVFKSSINNGGGGGAVSSVSNADGSLTISPTTGDIVASLNPAHTNTWTAQQNFTKTFTLGDSAAVVNSSFPSTMFEYRTPDADYVGTVSFTSGGNTVTGVGTAFASDFTNGDIIFAGGEYHVILSIATNNLSMTIRDTFSSTVSGVTYRKYAYGVGQVTTTSGSGSVTGLGTNFLQQFIPGDTFVVNGESRTVATVTSNVALTTDNWTGNNTGQLYIVKNKQIARMTNKGVVAIGNLSNTGDNIFIASKSSINAQGSITGLISNSVSETIASTSNIAQTLNLAMTVAASNTQNWTNTLALLTSNYQLSTLAGATGTISNGIVLRTSLQNTATGITFSNSYHILMSSPTNNGTITQGYGLYISPQNIGTQTNTPYAIYQEGTTDYNYFGGTTGFLSAIPTHTVTLGSTATGTAEYNTADQTTNYERALTSWVSNVYTIATAKGGSGTSRAISISSALGGSFTLAATNSITATGSNDSCIIKNTSVSGWSDFIFQDNSGTFKCGMGWGNASASVFANTFFIQANAVDTVFYSGTNGLTETARFINAGGLKITTGSVNLATNSAQFTIGSSNDAILTRKAAASFQYGAADAAAPVAQTLSIQNVVAGTTDTAGVNWTFNASQGTGTGAGGSLIFQVAPASTTGSTQNALATALTIASTKIATFTASIVSTQTALATTSADGLLLANTTAATVGVPVQISPRLHLQGQGWDTGTVATKVSDWIIENTPVSTNPINNSLVFKYSAGGAAYSAGMTLTNANLTVAGSLTSTQVVASSKISTTYAGAASTAVINTTGALLVSGTGTTNFPQYFAQPTGATAVTTWSTAGTFIGVNSNTGFAGNFIDFHLNGAASAFRVASTGEIAGASLTFSTTTGIVGTTTNNNAAAGSVGELIESSIASGSAVSLTNNTAANITSISLTAGDWDVWGNVVIAAAGGTIVTAIDAWIGTTSASAPAQPNGGAYAALQFTLPAGAKQVLPVGTTRLSLSGTTTVYLSTQVPFSVSTCTAYGYIGARRMR